MNYLMARDLWDLCDGSEAAPVQGQNETDGAFAIRDKVHKVRKASAMSILGQTISTRFTYLIFCLEVTTLREAWLTMCGQSLLSSKLALKLQLFHFQMQPGNSMQAHLRELNELVECLVALSAPVDEQDQVVLLLHSLPASFEGLVTAYLAKGEVQMAEVHEALFNHKGRLVSGGDDSSGYSAF